MGSSPVNTPLLMMDSLIPKSLEQIPEFRIFSKKLATAGQPDTKQLADLAKAGFEVIINLGLDNQDYSLPDEGGTVKKLGMVYVHIPVQWRAPACGPLHRFYGVLRDYEAKRLFIHCAENKRVAVFMFLYSVVVKGQSPKSAWRNLIKIWEPNETWLEFIRQEFSDNDIAFEIPGSLV